MSSCPVRHIRSDQDRVVQHTRIIGSKQRHRLLAAQNGLSSQQSQLSSECTPQLRPARPSARIFCETGPGALHVLAQTDLIGGGAGFRIRAEDAGDLDRVEGSCVGEELQVGERAVVAVAPDGLAAGGLDR